MKKFNFLFLVLFLLFFNSCQLNEMVEAQEEPQEISDQTDSRDDFSGYINSTIPKDILTKLKNNIETSLLDKKRADKASFNKVIYKNKFYSIEEMYNNVELISKYFDASTSTYVKGKNIYLFNSVKELNNFTNSNVIEVNLSNWEFRIRFWEHTNFRGAVLDYGKKSFAFRIKGFGSILPSNWWNRASSIKADQLDKYELSIFRWIDQNGNTKRVNIGNLIGHNKPKAWSDLRGDDRWNDRLFAFTINRVIWNNSNVVQFPKTVYSIESVEYKKQLTSQAIPMAGGFFQDFAHVKIKKKTSNNDQKWVIVPLENGYYSINSLSGLSLSKSAHGNDIFLRLFQKNNNAQQWAIEERYSWFQSFLGTVIGGGVPYYTLKNQKTGLYLDAQAEENLILGDFSGSTVRKDLRWKLK